MGDKLIAIPIALALIVLGFTVELAGIFIMAQAFPEIASTVWSWLTSLSIPQIITGLVGWFIYSMGSGFNEGVVEGVREEW